VPGVSSIVIPIHIMRNIIQVIGAPGAGKTTGIKNLNSDIKYFDIADFESKYYNKQELLYNSILDVSNNIIVESACGIINLRDIADKHFVIKLVVSKDTLQKQLALRKEEYNAGYSELLELFMIDHNSIVSNSSELTDALRFKIEEWKKI
jgi:hypothetical protein